MVEGRRGLGRGLSALLDEAEQATTPEARAAAGVEEIPIELIRGNPDQPRRAFSPEELEGLSDSIRHKGVLTPILLRPIPDSKRQQDDDPRYEIVAGERRWRASQAAGLRAIPALVRELNDHEVLEVALIENIQRQDLNAIEEARAYKSLMDQTGQAVETLATRVGKSRSHISNTMRLLHMPAKVQDHLIAGRLTAGHARAIAMGDNPELLADQVVNGGLSVRAAEDLARKSAAAPPKPRAPKRPKDADTHALETDLSEVLGLHVEIADKGGAGEVRIKYATLEQLDDLCRRLTRAQG